MQLELYLAHLHLHLAAVAMSRRCEAAEAALAFLDSLKFSCEADVTKLARAECPKCGKVVRLYCAKCVQSVVPIPQLHLGLRVLILRHPKEAAAKSSATPLSLLSRDIQVCEWPGGDFSPLSPGTWLVFPSQDAIDASSVDWSGVTGLVLVDSRWKHAKSVVDDPELKLKDLPAMKLLGAIGTVVSSVVSGCGCHRHDHLSSLEIVLCSTGGNKGTIERVDMCRCAAAEVVLISIYEYHIQACAHIWGTQTEGIHKREGTCTRTVRACIATTCNY